jgi:ADP-ribose pyrophosphatase
MTDDADADGTLAWETTGTRIEYRCPGFDIRRDDVLLPNRTPTNYHYVEEGDAVVILPFRGDGGDDEVVIVEEWRQAVGRVNRGLPAGGVEAGDDDIERAAERELREETGYEADRVEHLCTTEPVNGIADSVHHTFVAYGCDPTAEQDLDDNESIRTVTTSYEALVEAVRTGAVRDGRTALAVSRYEL